MLESVPGIRIIPFRDGIRANYWFYSLFCEDEYKYGRDNLIKLLSANKIQSRPVWWPICELPMYKNSRRYRVEKTLYYWNHIVNVPCSTNLTEDGVKRVVDLLK